MDGTHTQLFHGRGEEAARKYLPRLSAAGVAPQVVEWVQGGVILERGVPLPEWFERASGDAVALMRPSVIALVEKLHGEGVCHRDLHWQNVVIFGDEPRIIDFEHALDVDREWPCYDLLGPSERVPLLAAHATFGGVLGTQGIWWDAERDERWGLMYRPLGELFGPLQSSEAR